MGDRKAPTPPPPGVTVTADALNRLLAARHSDDVYVPECKMGMVGSRSLDGWALLSTWSPMTAIGYEIKVTRSDWLRDQKFEEYRTACHLFVVVAPKGVVERSELPSGVGLLEPIGQGTGTRLVMRVKPVRGKPDRAKLVNLMAYVLMWRRNEARFDAWPRARRAERWRTWVEERGQFRAIAASVTGEMRRRIQDAERRASDAEARAEALADAAEVLRELGIEPGYDRWSTRRRIEAALAEVGATDAIRSARVALERVEKWLRSEVSQ